jgi:heat shock protein HtpX
LLFRGFFNFGNYGWYGGGSSWSSSSSSSSSSSDSGGSSDRKSSGGGAILIIIVAVVLIVLAWALSQLVRLALSRSRELLADAGSVELTKNPDAMISALRKIEGRGELPGATSAVMELCVDNPREGFSDLFATHPSVESRVQALVKYAGGHYEGPLALPMHPSGELDDQPEAPYDGQTPPPLPGSPQGPPQGPWGSPADPAGTTQGAPQGPWGNAAGPWGRH